MKRRLGERGSVLLLVVVLLAVLSLLAVAAISFSRSELGAIKNERSGDELVACADAGRQYMVSRFNLLESVPSNLEPVNVNLNADLSNPAVANCPGGANVPEDARCMRSGHLGEMAVAGITLVNSGAGGSNRNVSESSNTIDGNMLGSGKPYKLIVHCLDESGRGTEVEFVVRFGL